jgi:hypothetical protein
MFRGVFLILCIILDSCVVNIITAGNINSFPRLASHRYFMLKLRICVAIPLFPHPFIIGARGSVVG